MGRPGGRGIALAAAAVLHLAPAVVHADEFFQVRDENPLVRGFYLPLPSDSRLNEGGSISATFLITNTLNVENDAPQSLHVDGESDVLSLTYENSLFRSWRYRLTVPLIHDSGGILDSVIDDWHALFGLPQGNRRYYPRNQLLYSYSGRGDVNIDVHGSDTGIGGIAGDVGWYALDDAQRTVSLWGGLQAPTGSVSKLTGDGAWDGALWAHGAMRWLQWQLAAEIGVAQPFGDEIFAGYAHRTSAFARLAVTRALGSSWSLRAQLDGQTARLSDNDIRFLGPSLQLSVGAERRLSGRWRLEFGIIEDVAVNTAPDVTFFLGIRG
jgi:hypothetical protein